VLSDKKVEISGVNGVLIYRDKFLQNKYYWTSTQPRVARIQENYQFTCIQYDPLLNDSQAGVLSMVIDLSVPPDLCDRVKNELRKLSGDNTEPQLLPIPWLSGTVALSFPMGEPILSQPSLVGSNAAVFQIELSTDQLLVLKESLENNQIPPISIVYGLVYETIRPAYECKVNINWSKYRDYVEKKCTFGLGLISFEKTETFEEIKSDQVITVECIDYGDDFKIDILKSLSYFLTPLPVFAPVPNQSGGGWSIGYSCKEMKDIQKIERLVDLDVETEKAVKHSTYIQGNIDRFQEAYAQHPIQILPTATHNIFEQKLTATCYANYEQDSIQQVVVYIYKQEEVYTYFSFKANSTSCPLELTYNPTNQDRYEWNYVINFTDGIYQQLKSAKRPIERHHDFLSIIPNELYTSRPISISTSKDFPWSLIRTVRIDMKLSQEEKNAPDPFALTERNSSALWNMFSPNPNLETFFYQVTYLPKSGDNIIENWKQVSNSIFLNPFKQRGVKFWAKDIDWCNYEEIFLDVECEDSANALDGSQTLTMTEDNPRAEFVYYYSNNNQKQKNVTYTATFISEAGSICDSDPQSTRELNVSISEPQK
jgi:hypothetical protein